MTIQSAAVRLAPSPITDLLHRLFRAEGCGEEEAGVIARHLVDASLAGHDSHGIIRTPRYHQWLQTGTIFGGRTLRVVNDAGALLQFDGDSGMGQWVAWQATTRAMERARAEGAAIVGMRNAGHIGRLGTYAERACEAGLVTVQFCNVAGSNLVAPFGAAERRISTAPVSVGVPNADGHFILDFATSLVAEGKALVAASGGKALPGNALVDADGAMTGDPRVLYGDSMDTAVPNPRGGPGALRTMGEHKGSGLALACELLAGALTGNGTNAAPRPFNNGWFALFLDPARFEDTAVMDEVAAYVEAVRGARPAQGVDRVRIPGDVERETRAARLEEGIPLPRDVFEAIVSIAAELSVEADRNALILGEAAGPA